MTGADSVPCTSSTRVAHSSERQLAKLLDFYAIAWEYEPVTFVLERDRHGRPAHAFTPDLCLPAYGLFIEITTLNQKLVPRRTARYVASPSCAQM